MDSRRYSIGVMKGDIRSLDYSACGVPCATFRSLKYGPFQRPFRVHIGRRYTRIAGLRAHTRDPWFQPSKSVP